jgi:hypothetical protein
MKETEIFPCDVCGEPILFWLSVKWRSGVLR